MVFSFRAFYDCSNCVLLESRAKHTVSSVFPHLKMHSLVRPTTVDQPGGNQSFNGTNVTIPVLDPCTFCLVSAPFYVVVLVFILVVLALVVAAKTLPLVIRFVVANILIANFTAGLGVLVIVLTRSIVTRVRHFSLTDGPCRFLIALISVGGTIRPVIMATFAVVVCIIIMKSISAVKFKVLSICMLILWLLCLAFCSTIFIPGVMRVITLQDTGCVPRSGPYTLVISVPFFLCFLLIPFALTVVVLIATFWYVRVRSVRDHIARLRPLLKFSAFLLLGNLLSALGQAAPVIVAHVESDATSEMLVIINRSNGIIVLLSIIPTPILVLVYFRPVRTLMKRCFLHICRNVCKNSLGVSMQKHLVDKMLPS